MTCCIVSSMGSSPRMRGTLDDRVGDAGRVRIIPADAGNTHHRMRAHSWGGDHPRGCGEHLAVERTECAQPGSSPRMRGTLLDWSSSVTRLRIIPADAGNTLDYEHMRDLREDHPRGCGEHVLRETHLYS